MEGLEVVDSVTIKELLSRIFLRNWQRKLIAFTAAVVIWFIVADSMTLTRVFPDTPVRIINLPKDKTVLGLLPNQYLSRKISVTLTGEKSFISELNSNDLEIVINADGHMESWIASISKKNLYSPVYEADLKKKVNEVHSNDIFIKISNLVTEDIPVLIGKPSGDPPKGYQFLDVWPPQLFQRVSGPQEHVEALKEKGIELTFNLNQISKEELDALSDLPAASKKDEIGFFIPDEWKQVSIPFHDGALEPLNDPRAEFLRIDFLRQELIPLGMELPISIFFPVKYSRTLNPETYSLSTSAYVERKNGLKLFTTPLFARDVSRLFLDIAKDNMEITIIAAPISTKENLDWTVTFFDQDELEEKYIQASIKQINDKFAKDLNSRLNEMYLRNRFREYMRQFTLYLNEETPLQLKAKLEANTISIQLDSAQ